MKQNITNMLKNSELANKYALLKISLNKIPNEKF